VIVKPHATADARRRTRTKPSLVATLPALTLDTSSGNVVAGLRDGTGVSVTMPAGRDDRGTTTAGATNGASSAIAAATQGRAALHH
jgi:hypothetical protein